MVRLFNCLKETLTNPSRASIIGVTWWPPTAAQSRTICINTGICGAYLSLRSNSINKDLALFGWQMMRFRPNWNEQKIRFEFPDPQGWRLRTSIHNLSSASTLADFRRISPPVDPGRFPVQSLQSLQKLELNICQSRLLDDAIAGRPTEWISEFTEKVESLWGKLSDRLTGDEPGPRIVDVAAMLNEDWENSRIQRLLVHFSRDEMILQHHEFVRFFLWFGFNRTTTDLILRTLDTPSPLVKFILWPISHGAASQLQNTAFDGWIIALSETPGTFRIFSKTLSKSVVYDALTDEFMVEQSSFKFRSLHEVIDEVSRIREEIPFDFHTFDFEYRSSSFKNPFPELFDRLDPSFE
jgi:hypothetical protein